MPVVLEKVTVLCARALGGPEKSSGNFVLAPLKLVQKTDFWKTHGSNIGCIVNCIGKRGGVSGSSWYPQEACKLLQMFVDVHDPHSQKTTFTAASRAAENTLPQSKEVLVHCRERPSTEVLAYVLACTRIYAE